MKENMQKYTSIEYEIDGIPEMYFHSYVWCYYFNHQILGTRR